MGGSREGGTPRPAPTRKYAPARRKSVRRGRSAGLAPPEESTRRAAQLPRHSVGRGRGKRRKGYKSSRDVVGEVRGRELVGEDATGGSGPNELTRGDRALTARAPPPGAFRVVDRVYG